MKAEWSPQRVKATPECVDVVSCHLIEASKALPAVPKRRSTRWPARWARFHAINAALSLAAGGGSYKRTRFSETRPQRSAAARQTYTSAAHPAAFPDRNRRLGSTRAPGCDLPRSVRVDAVPQRDAHVNVIQKKTVRKNRGTGAGSSQK